MNVLIISDSHGLEEELFQIKQKYGMSVDYMIHCGDSELPFDHEAIDGFTVVRGNCDLDQNLPNDRLLDFTTSKIFATHGHLYNVKMTLMNLHYRAEELGANIVCFGHSHLAGSEKIDQTVFINPGSIHLPRGRRDKTYCILELHTTELNVIFYNHKHDQVLELCRTYKL
ncbi:metallophosphoesterase [Bacillus sp. DJP31]|uniref:metallophosphoesterase n=1 Tax=Bacillus sp. DJP31 TaxID=3409789 RepID=UPI003BB73213